MRDTITLVRALITMSQANEPDANRAWAWAEISRHNDMLHIPSPPPPPSKKARTPIISVQWYGKRFYTLTNLACQFALVHTHSIASLHALEDALVQCLAEPLQ